MTLKLKTKLNGIDFLKAISALYIIIKQVFRFLEKLINQILKLM